MSLVSDRERERAATVLRRQYLNGRLSIEQLSERMELALVARDRRDLRRVFSGLPPAWLDGDELRRLGGVARRAAVLAVIAATWLIASLVLLVGFTADAIAHGLGRSSLVFVVLWLLVTVLGLRARRRA